MPGNAVILTVSDSRLQVVDSNHVRLTGQWGTARGITLGGTSGAWWPEVVKADLSSVELSVN